MSWQEYTPHTHADGHRLNVLWERPAVEVPDPNIVTYLPGPRARLIIEGEHELVHQAFAALKPTIDALRALLSAPPEEAA